MADMGGAKTLSVTPGATVTLTIDPTVRHMVASWTASEIESINISGTPLDGQELICLITNDGALGRLLTFATGFSPDGTLLGITGKKSLVIFRAVGGTFYEASRKIGVLS
jgi:hypothetical protein